MHCVYQNLQRNAAVRTHRRHVQRDGEDNEPNEALRGPWSLWLPLDFPSSVDWELSPQGNGGGVFYSIYGQYKRIFLHLGSDDRQNFFRIFWSTLKLYGAYCILISLTLY